MTQPSLFSNTAVYKKNFVSLDLETTHLDFTEGKIMEIGAVEAEIFFDARAQEVKYTFGQTFDLVVNPGIEPSESALAITGISREEIAAAPKWQDVKQKLAEFLEGKNIIGHNLAFDLGFLKNQGLALKNQYFDTLEIGQTILPLENSHSLEMLGESLGVLEGISHRAGEDAKNTIRILCAILNGFANYAPDLKKGVLELLDHKEVGFYELLRDLPRLDASKSRHAAGDESAPPPKKHSEYESIKIADKTVISLPASFGRQEDLLEHLFWSEKSLVAAVPHPFWLEKIPAGRQLPSPNLALCSVRAEILRRQEEMPVIWRKIFAKVLIGRRVLPVPIDLSRLRWMRPERDVLSAICAESGVCKEHDCEYAKFLRSAASTAKLARLDSVLDLAADWRLDFSKSKLVIFGLSSFEESFTESLTRVYNLRTVRFWLTILYSLPPTGFGLLSSNHIPAETEKIANEIDLFFGVLHLVYLKAEGEFAQSQVVDDREAESDRFQKLLHPAEKLTGRLREFADWLSTRIIAEEKLIGVELAGLRNKILSLADFLQEFFQDRQNEKIYWFKFNDTWVDLNCLPKNPALAWRTAAARFKSVTIIDAGTPKISLPYFQRRLGLSDFRVAEWKGKTKSEPVKVELHENPFAKEKLLEFIRSLTGRSLVVVPNENLLGQYFTALVKQPKSGPEILAYKYSGSHNALRAKTARSTYTLLLTTNALMKYWHSLPEINNLVVLRLPFEPKASKVSLLGLSAREEFPDHVLPRAIQVLHQILTRFLSGGGKNQKIFLLDDRISRGYDGAFMEYLGEYPNFSISTAKTD